jgi:2-dehydro-3-deoxygalactonokinase
MIGVDWGISSVRAYRLRERQVLERREEPNGILAVRDGRFGDALRRLVGPWLAAGEDRVLLCGMVGSRQGWQETGAVPCPAGIAEIADALADVPFDGARVRLVPGVTGTDDVGTPEIMRGEETQIMGAEIGAGAACLPGSHSKWARIVNGRITAFATYLTGEAFAALRDHTILARQMRDASARVPASDASTSDASTSDGAFDAGVARSADSGGVLHHVFGIRSLGLVGRLPDADATSYLSGLLIGHEVRAALRPADEVWVIGSTSLSRLYARAIVACGGVARLGDADAAAQGLGIIAARAIWS